MPMERKRRLLTRPRQNVLAAAVLAAATAAGLLVALRVWPFGDGSLLTGDLNGMYVAFLADLRDRFWSGGFLYSLRKLAGGSTLGLLAYYMASPLNVLYLIFPKEAYSEVINLCFVLRAAGAAAAFCFYIQRRLGSASRTLVAASLGYALCAFFIVYNQNVIWMDVVALLPLLMWGLDVLVEQDRKLPFTLLLAAAMVMNFYTAYSVCIFAVLYFVYRWFAWGGAGAARQGEAVPGEGGDRSLRGFGRAAGRLAVGGVLGAGLSMVLLVPALMEVLAGGDLGSAGFSLSPNFPLYRLPERLFPGTFFWGDVIDGLPNLYCGLFAVMLAGMYLALRDIRMREKMAAAGVLAVLILSMWLEGFDLLWQGFKPPTWFPHRYSFVFSFFLLLLACRGLVALRRRMAAGAAGSPAFSSGRAAVGLLAGGAVFIVYTVAVAKPDIISLPKIAMAALAVAGVAAAVWLWGMGKARRRQVATALFCLVVVADVGANALLSIRKFDYYPRSGFVSYVQGAAGTVAALQAANPGLYRVETTSFRTLNDAMLVGYTGISHYSSLMPGGVPLLRERLGYVNYSVYGWGSTAVADSLLGIRYLYSNGENRAVPAHYQMQEAATPFAAYQNPTAFPLAYTAPAALLEVDPAGGLKDTFALQNAIAATLAPEVGTPLVPVEAEMNTGGYLRVEAGMPVGGPLYFSLPYAGQAPAELRVNGEVLANYFEGDTLGGVICLGSFAAGEAVVIELDTPASEENRQAVKLYALDSAAMAALAEAVQANAAQNLVAEDGGHIRCTAQAGDENQILVLSFGYEESWRLTVNGQEAELLPLLEGLMAVRLPAGESAIELRYTHPGGGVGLCVTLVSAALLALWVLLGRRAGITKKGGRA